MDQLERRQVLKSGMGAIVGGLGVSNNQNSSNEGSKSAPSASIKESVFDEEKWSVKTINEVGSIPSDNDIKFKSETNRYVDSELRQRISDETDGTIDINWRFVWTTKCKPTDSGTAQKWSSYSNHGEAAESPADIDDLAERGFEQYIFENANGGSFRRKAPEVHMGHLFWLGDITAGLVPVLGDILPYGFSYIFDKSDSINTRTGESTFLVKYFLDLPITSALPGVSEGLDNELIDVSIDYRGWYIDWFHEGDFYAAGALHPESSEHLQNQVRDVMGDEGITIPKPNLNYQDKSYHLLRNIG